MSSSSDSARRLKALEPRCRADRRRCLSLGLAAGLAAAWPASRTWANETPGTPPNAAPRIEDFEWVDGARQRPVPVRVYHPTGPVPAAGTPLMVFSHGIGGSRRSFSWLGLHAARHGVTALHLQHVGSDRQLWGGNPLTVIGRLHGAAQDSEALARAQDLRFALDQWLGSASGAQTDRQRIVAAGHSYGANTAMLVGGARVQRGGQGLDLRDERIAAAVLLSAPPFYGEDDLGAIVGPIGLPTLHITSTEDVIRIPGYWSTPADRLAVYQAMGGPSKCLAMFQGGEHSMFSDRVLAKADAALLRKKDAAQELVLAFLQASFEGRREALLAWPRRHAGLLARFEGGVST